MAKKKKSTKTRRRPAAKRGGRRGRIRGIGGVAFEQAGLALVGGLAGRVVTNATKNVKFIQDKPIVRIGAKAAAGYYLLTLKNPMLNDFAMGWLGETALDAAGHFAPNVFGASKLAPDGVGAVVIDLDEQVSGYDETFVAGTGNDDMYVAGAI